MQDGQPGHWKGPVSFAIDLGPLGALSNQEAATQVRTAVSHWQAVATSTIEFSEQPSLPLDVTADNLDEFFGGTPIGGGDLRPENPIIFDDDGSIIDLLMGSGASSSVLGFAGPRFIDRTSREFVSGFGVFNGRFAGTSDFFSTIVHEIGHLVGLDHTQTLHALASNGVTADNDLVPLMYPFAISGAAETPLQDDRNWLSWLAPSADFAQTTGRIEGTIRRRSGVPMQGANVVAVRVDENLTESVDQVTSVVSGFLIENQGRYLLPGLLPGTYVLYIEPLSPTFVDGSSVGPFDVRFSDFPKDYYNGADEGGTILDSPGQRTVLLVNAGQTLAGVDLVTNEPNLAPVVDAGDNRIVLSGQIVQLIATVVDPDNDPLTFSWGQIQGIPVQLSSTDQLSTSFTAPGVVQPQALLFELRAQDGLHTTVDTVRITVIPVPENRPPTVDAGPAQIASKGETVRLEAEAVDPDDDVLEYSWRQLSGPAVNLIDADLSDATFVAPSLQQTRQLVFEVVVSDGKGGFADDSVVVTVLKNRPPTVALEPIHSAQPGETVVLDARGSDLDGDTLSYFWIQLSGPSVSLSGAQQSRATFSAPSAGSSSILEFRVRVSDGVEIAEGTTIVIVSEAPPVVIPNSLRLHGSFLEDSFIGGAVVNFGDEEGEIFVRGLDLGGDEIAPLTVARLLSPNGQMAFLTENISGSSRLGSLILHGRTSIKGFFLLGDNASKRLDGVGGPPIQADHFYFARGAVNPDEDTVLFLFNTDGLEGNEVQLSLRDRLGEVIAQQTVTIASSGSLIDSLGNLFGSLEAEDVYIEVEAEKPLRGVAIHQSREHVSAGSALIPTELTALHAPHFFTDGLQESTTIRLINLGGDSVQARLTAFNNQSDEFGSKEYVLEPGELLSVPVDSLGGFEPGVLATGYLRIDVNEGQVGPFLNPAQVIGEVRFSGNDGKVGSTLPLMRRPSRGVAFLHVAQFPELDLFQGLAILNRGTAEASVTVEAFSSDGSLSASRTLAVAPGRRIVDVLNSSTFFGAGFSQAGGHLRVTSDRPVFTLSLFGDTSQEFLAAVEGHPLEEPQG